MTRKMILPLVFGIAGTAILVALGVWQLQRLDWKEGVIAEIEARIVDAPVAIPATPDPDRDQYLPVVASGRITGEEAHVLVSVKRIGPGYRIVSGFEIEGGRRVLLDRGFIRETAKDAPRPGGEATVTGNLHWPDEIDRFTPAPDLDGNIWFARDIPALAEALGTEPVLVVLRETSEQDPPVTPFPVDTSGIPNNHFGYAVQWFGMALVWAGMTAFFLWRIRRRTD